MTWNIQKARRGLLLAPRGHAVRRGLVALAAASACLMPWLATAAPADTFPSRPVKIVVPFPPGAANDVKTRAIAEKLAERWRQPVIVDNRPGGSSIIGTSLVAEAPADGYTLLANVTLMIQNPLLRKNLAYDPAKLVPVTQINRQQLMIAVNGNTAVHNLDELAALARQKPGQLNYATFGIGSSAHLMLAKFAKDRDLDLVHVPYKGSGDMLRALLAGEVQISVTDPLSPQQYFASGAMRPIAVTGPQRSPRYPNVQTMEEAGITGFDGYNWLGLFAPAGTPDDVIRKISDAFNEVQRDPKMVAWLEETGVMPAYTTPTEFREIFERDRAVWAEVIRVTGVTVD